MEVAGLADAKGTGFTVMVTDTGVPVQPLAVGVMLYCTVPEETPEVDRTCEMVLPDPPEAPVTPLTGVAVQE